MKYTDAQIKLLREDINWIEVNQKNPNISADLFVDVSRRTNSTLKDVEATKSTEIIWSHVFAYRLTNNKYFKDGIYNGYADGTDESFKHYDNWAAQKNPLTYSEALEEQKKHDGIAIDYRVDEQAAEADAMKFALQENGNWLEDNSKLKYIVLETLGSTHFSYPDGTISDVLIKDGMNNGVKYTLIDNKWEVEQIDTGPLSAHYKLDAAQNIMSANQVAYEEQQLNEWVDGLPPIGSKIEYTPTTNNIGSMLVSGTWYEGTIIHYHDGYVWTSDNGLRRIDLTEFRPILTPKQRTIEAAAKALSVCQWRSSHEMVNALYDAGMLTLPGESS